jgi:hypothetical protein
MSKYCHWWIIMASGELLGVDRPGCSAGGGDLFAASGAGHLRVMEGEAFQCASFLSRIEWSGSWGVVV